MRTNCGMRGSATSALHSWGPKLRWTNERSHRWSTLVFRFHEFFQLRCILLKITYVRKVIANSVATTLKPLRVGMKTVAVLSQKTLDSWHEPSNLTDFAFCHTTKVCSGTLGELHPSVALMGWLIRIYTVTFCRAASCLMDTLEFIFYVLLRSRTSLHIFHVSNILILVWKHVGVAGNVQSPVERGENLEHKP